jgi:acetyltransferase-like isoleucine patch superfamily enzyme
MTILSTILSLFPTITILMTVASLLFICISPGISILAVIFSLYGFPLLVYRLHDIFYPVKEGISYLQGKEYSPWWGSHQIQVIYIAFPALETILRLIPGAFSLWLRLWGAKVGTGVYWTPKLEISDRSLIEIGDRVIFGHGIGIYCHAIKPKNNDLMLYIKKVKIGNNVFIGGGSRLAPGVIIEDKTYIPVTTDLYPNTKIEEE